VATWAFANGNRFDLVAVPRLTGVALDASYLDLAALDRNGESPADTLVSVCSRHRAPVLSILSGVVALAALITGLAWYRGNDPAPASPASVSSIASLPEPESPLPNRAAYRDEQVNAEQSRQVVEALLALAERFGVSTAGAGPGQDDPSVLMVLLAEHLRYRGPLLSAAERASLVAAPRGDRESALALRWHARMHRFAPDRPLPGDFSRGPLRWQLATLAWSFHLDSNDLSEGRRSPSEAVHALSEALANDLPLAPCRLSERHQALAAYRDFLGRLPRR
jgi:hypothetical protein